MTDVPKPCDYNDCDVLKHVFDIKRSTPDEKKEMAKLLYGRGETMERIGEKLGVTKGAISQWLNCLDAKQSKPAKTASNPKGAGRPKGSKKAKVEPAKHTDKVVPLMNAGKSTAEIVAATGIHERVASRIIREENIRREAEPEIDPGTLSIPDKKKLEIAQRQMERRLAAEFDARVMAEVERRMDTMVLPAWRKTIEWAKAVQQRDKGILTAAEYKMIRTCLHPDRVQDEALKRRFTQAFGLLERLERFLCGPEKEPPDKFPRTWREAQSSSKRAAEGTTA